VKLTAIIEREGNGYVSLCPQLDIASQGDTVEQARHNLEEALGLFFECASAEEIRSRLKTEVYVTEVEVAVGQVAGLVGPAGLCDSGKTRFRRGPQTRKPHRHAEEIP
jgi:predicted RNase H-like HicB family nuclease